MHVTLELMFAAVTPGRVEKVDGPTRGFTTGRDGSGPGAAGLPVPSVSAGLEVP